jgi:asparagine synthase (glutamine-hydrolysing)
MCGIVGVMNVDRQPVDAAVLADMAATLSHRGPDGEGSLVEGAVGLFHKRLAIIDLVTGQQPMSCDGLTIVFNGEIYNFVELREDLERRGHRFRTTSDTEVILHAYQEYGLDAIPRLNGIFAFLLLDRPGGRLVAARDHFGVKPLYVHASEARWLFASEIKALLRHPGVAAEVDVDSLGEYLTLQYVLGERTLFRGIRKVLPGHYLVVDLTNGDSRTVRYWEPRFAIDRHHTEEYFVEKLHHLIADAVKIQMRSDVPVGAYLSGGMDSSIVTTLASRLSPAPLATYTGAFAEGPEFDETRYAADVARACHAEVHTIYPTEDDFIATMPLLVRHMDEPVAGPGLFPQYMVSRLATRDVKVCLGGQGGDEVFGGYARYVIAYLEQALKGAIFETNEEGEHIVSLHSILPNLPYLRAYVPMLVRFQAHGVFEAMDRRYFRLIDRSEGTLDVFSGDFRALYQPERVFARFQGIFNHPDTQSYYNKMTHYDLVAGLPALLHVEDRVSMASSLESRVPLLDHRIADLVGSMPPAMKFKGAEMKYILKRATRGLLPPSIVARKDKMGFPVPLHLWARHRARRFFEDVLLSPRCRQRGLFDAGQVERLMTNEAAFSRRLWGLLCVELWHREFIDARA